MLGCIVDICATSDVTAAMGVLTSQVDLVRITRPVDRPAQYILGMTGPEPYLTTIITTLLRPFSPVHQTNIGPSDHRTIGPSDHRQVAVERQPRRAYGILYLGHLKPTEHNEVEHQRGGGRLVSVQAAEYRRIKS